MRNHLQLMQYNESRQKSSEIKPSLFPNQFRRRMQTSSLDLCWDIADSTLK